LGLVVDAAVIAANCDGGVLVLSENSRYKQAQRVIDQVNKSGCKFLGVVRNRVMKKPRTAYYKKKS
jgi:Mrp family chromosome partitioning ATPase